MTEEDLDQLEDYQTAIDDQISVGSLEFLDRSVDVINNSIERVEQCFGDIINMDIDLHAPDSIVLNADVRGYAEDEDELKSFWQQLVRYEIMLKVSDLKDAQMEDESQTEAVLIQEAKEHVKESFEGWFERLKGLRRSDRFEDYLNAITSAYDPHSNYFSPRDKESFDQEMYGTYEGIGARLIPEGELTKVTQIIPGGPAWKQKELEVNDFIIMVAQDGEEPKDVRGWRQDDVIDLIRGKKGTRVQLTVRKQDGSLAEIAIVRDQVILEEGNAKSLMLQLGDEGPEIGYILLPKFYFESGDKSGCADDVAREIKRLSDEGANGLILDLRNNGGGLLNAATGPCQGKGGNEQSLLRGMLETLDSGDILLGDAYYPTYFLLCDLVQRGIDGVFEQYGARKRSTDFRTGVRLGARDHLIVLSKPKDKPEWMTQAAYDRSPATLTVREFKAGGKIMITTFLDAHGAPKNQLKFLYRRRWNVELDLRNIKTTLGMERLRCKSPEMAIKELWVYLLAYNMIRLLMAQAALLADQVPRQLSFKHTAQIWLSWQQRGGAMHDGVAIHALLVLIAEPRVGLRPGRIEPRALKRRRNQFPLMIKPRQQARAEVLEHGHPKKQR